MSDVQLQEVWWFRILMYNSESKGKNYYCTGDRVAMNNAAKTQHMFCCLGFFLESVTVPFLLDAELYTCSLAFIMQSQLLLLLPSIRTTHSGKQQVQFNSEGVNSILLFVTCFFRFKNTLGRNVQHRQRSINILALNCLEAYNVDKNMATFSTSVKKWTRKTLISRSKDERVIWRVFQ